MVPDVIRYAFFLVIINLSIVFSEIRDVFSSLATKLWCNCRLLFKVLKDEAKDFFLHLFFVTFSFPSTTVGCLQTLVPSPDLCFFELCKSPSLSLIISPCPWIRAKLRSASKDENSWKDRLSARNFTQRLVHPQTAQKGKDFTKTILWVSTHYPPSSIRFRFEMNHFVLTHRTFDANAVLMLYYFYKCCSDEKYYLRHKKIIPVLYLFQSNQKSRSRKVRLQRLRKKPTGYTSLRKRDVKRTFLSLPGSLLSELVVPYRKTKKEKNDTPQFSHKFLFWTTSSFSRKHPSQANFLSRWLKVSLLRQPCSAPDQSLTTFKPFQIIH